jgi:serine/threonine protein kinase
MADVHEVNDEYFQRSVAWKKLKKGPKVKQRSKEFLREAQIMSGLEHPGIVPTHALITTENDNLPALTMGKVSGMSLSEKITEAKKDPMSWPLEERIQIMGKLAEALSYAHEKKIVHRDIKPSNVMLGEYGEAFLMDWGLAKVLQNEDEETVDSKQTVLKAQMSMAGSIKGTPYYMSPEAARGKSEYVDESSDIFSLGALFYELLTLNYFIKGQKTLEVLKNASESNYNDTSKDTIEAIGNLGSKKCDPELIYILEKCVDPVRQTRYKDAEQLKEHIYCYQNSLPIKGYEGNFVGYALQKWLSRNGWKVVLFIIPILISLLYLFHIGSNKKHYLAKKVVLEKSISDLKAKIEKNENIKSNLLSDRDKVQSEMDRISKGIKIIENKIPKENSNLEEAIQLRLNENFLKDDINDLSYELIAKQDQRIEQETEYDIQAEKLIENENKLKQEKGSYEIEQICLWIQKIVASHAAGHQDAAKRELSRLSRELNRPYALRLLRLVWNKKRSPDNSFLNKFKKVDSIPVVEKESSVDLEFEHPISSGYKHSIYNPDNDQWLIYFSGFGITRLKCVDNITGDFSEKWSTNFKQLEKVFLALDNWYVLGGLGELYFLKSGFPARHTLDNVDSFFPLKKINIGFAVSGNRLDVILLGTGDKLYSVGKIDKNIENIEFINNSIYITTEEAEFYKLEGRAL